VDDVVDGDVVVCFKPPLTLVEGLGSDFIESSPRLKPPPFPVAAAIVLPVALAPLVSVTAAVVVNFVMVVAMCDDAFVVSVPAAMLALAEIGKGKPST